MKSSTKDQAKGKFHEVKGKVKEIAGKLSGNPELEAEGKDEKIAGAVQTRLARLRRSWGNRRDKYLRPVRPGFAVAAARGAKIPWTP